MHTRPATPADFSATASLSVDCFWDDELFAYTNPWRRQYPDHFRDSSLRRHRLRYWSPGFIFHVAVTDDGDEGHKEGGTVVGYAIWQRRGTSDAAKIWLKDSYWMLFERLLLQATERYLSLTYADKSIDYNRIRHFYAQSIDDFSAIPELWKLKNLAVHPNFQHRGIATSLMSWGKEQAEREGCPIGLESSERARPYYIKNGFRKYGTINIELREFPLDDVPIFLWEPRGMEGRWGTRE
ncbi:hypothetical protein MMC28_004521 [Mycoblastus sanguinarius]|nr:hypothetical protein [Mycoblastus sanguinarius]